MTQLKNAFINNAVRIIFAAIIGLITIAYAACKEPVQEIFSLPGQMNEMQAQMTSNDQLLMNVLNEQRRTDSVILEQIVKLQTSDNTLRVEVGTIKTYMHAIKDELPALHQRFNDIENTVKNAQGFSEYASKESMNPIYNKEKFNIWRQNKELRQHSRFYDKICSRNPRLQTINTANNKSIKSYRFSTNN
ncbi:MAG: hypothetical protein N4A71_05665 [Carboxylicivirga sp.]|jgi:polyhydroxyalkanoate synthesis regulator phasin|nr:hypothetical protein [Carboxylicivirga sp.]